MPAVAPAISATAGGSAAGTTRQRVQTGAPLETCDSRAPRPQSLVFLRTRRRRNSGVIATSRSREVFVIPDADAQRAPRSVLRPQRRVADRVLVIQFIGDPLGGGADVGVALDHFGVAAARP